MTEEGSGNTDPECIDRATLDAFVAACTPAYLPNWSEIYRLELESYDLPGSSKTSGCGVEGAACHAQVNSGTEIRPAAGATGGFLLNGDSQQTHSMLLAGERPFIDLNQPECSPFIVRLLTTNSARWMPPDPSQPYAEGRRCAMAQWVLAGAKFQ